MPSPFVIDPHLTGIAIAYRVPHHHLIADQVAPRVPVGKREFAYSAYPIEDSFTIPDTRVGRTSRPNKLEYSGTRKTAEVEDYGLDIPVPQDDIDNAPKNHDPVKAGTERASGLIMLDREVRVAKLYQNRNNYAADKRVVLSGNSQFSDYANSDPVEVISEALDKPLMRPNLMALGRQAFSKISRHPAILKSVHGNSGDAGIARLSQIEDLFEVKIAVGDARFNIKKPGEEMELAYGWGPHISLAYVDPTADTNGGVTFAFTAEYGNRVSGSYDDKNIGLRGGKAVRTGESVKELTIAPECGFFIEDAVAV